MTAATTKPDAGIIRRRETCRGCGGAALDLIFRLKPSPIGDAYVSADRLNEVQPTYPIDLYMCRTCGLAQLLDVIDPDVLYGDYLYVTGSSLGLARHFDEYATDVIRRRRLDPGSLVVDLGSNDGTLLRAFQAKGMRVLGVEPAEHIAARATEAGVPTLGAFFTAEVAARIVDQHGAPKVVTANNVVANIDDLTSWIAAVKALLAEDGIFVFESYYLADLVTNMVFDFIYHEHLSAFSVRPVKALFEAAGLELAAVQRVATKGGSLRYFVQRPGGPLANDGSVAEMSVLEDRMGLYAPGTFERFAARIDGLKARTLDYLAGARAEGKAVAGFGASITGTTLIYHFEIGRYLEYLVDDNPAKQGRYSPGLHLPVFSSGALEEKKPDCVVVLAWRYADAFIGQHQRYLDAGGTFVVPVPEFKIVGRA